LISKNFFLCFGRECFASDAQVKKLIVISFGSFEVLFHKAREILSEKCCVHRVGNDVVPDNLDSSREKLHTNLTLILLCCTWQLKPGGN
jgi:hypothetical protein